MIRNVFALATIVAAVASFSACSVDPTNPYDPQTDPSAQEPARIIGRVLLDGRDLNTDPVELLVTLPDGRFLEQGGAPQVFTTRTDEDGFPAGMEDDGLGAAGTFEVPVQPGTYGLVFSASRNGAALYDDLEVGGIRLGPGETVRRDVRPVPLPSNVFAGAIRGEVEGAQPGQSFLVRLVPLAEGAGLEERTITLSEDSAYLFKNLIPGVSYLVRAEGDGYAPAVSEPLAVGPEHTEESPLVAPSLRLGTLGRIFSVDHQAVGAERPYVGTTSVPVTITGGVYLAAEGALRFQARARPRDDLDDLLAAESAGDDVDSGWIDVEDASSLTVDLDPDADATDGDHVIGAQLRVCLASECECPADAPVGSCTPPITSGIADLPVVLDREAPALVEIEVAGVPSRPSDAEVPVLLAGCARFGAGCPVAAMAEPWTPLIEAQLNDRSGRVAGWAATFDAAEPGTFLDVTATAGLANVGGNAPGVDPVDGELVLGVWARDAAGNVGLVHERPIRVDVTSLGFADPALVLTGTEIYPVDGTDVEIIPGELVSIDVALADDATPVRWRVRRTDGSLLTGQSASGLSDYNGPITAFVAGLHNDEVTLVVDVEDDAGNVSSSPARALRLWRTGNVIGGVTLEGGGTPSDLSAVLTDADGVQILASSFTDGTYRFDEVLRGSYDLALTVPGFETLRRPGVVVQPARDTQLGELQLVLPRGDIAGQFELEGREGTTNNAGIQVSLLNGAGDAVDGTTTLADGSFAFEGVPVGTGYVVVGNYEGFVPAQFPGVEVFADAESIVNDDGAGSPLAIVLRELVGDFKLCAPTGKLSDTCEPLLWTALTDVEVAGVNLDGISDFRVATAPFPDATTGWTAVAQDVDGDYIPPSVTLGGAGEQRYTVYVQLRTDVNNPGDVLTSEIVYDATPPVSPTVSLRRGPDALLDGFTNAATVTATVSADAGTGDVAPLGDAYVVFATSPPGSVPANTRCSHGSACGVPLDDTAERLHDAYAFSCDAAGNCGSTPATAAIVYDSTPPRQLHGVAFSPSSPVVQTFMGTTYTRSAQYDIDVDVGAAQTDGGAAVQDVDGDPVPDVVGYRFGVTDPPTSGNGSFAFAGIDVEQFQNLLAAGATLTTSGPPLPGVDATYRVYGQLVDAAGNETVLEDNPFHFDITLDTSAPGITFELNGGADYTNNPVVTLDTSGSALDPAVLARISNDSGLFDDFDERTYPFEPGQGTYDLTVQDPTDGLATVYARFLDSAGNVAERSASIYLDRQPPSALLVGCSTCATHQGVRYTNDSTRQVVLDLLASDNSGFVESVDVTGLGAPVAYTSALPVTLPVDMDGPQALDVTFIDPAGNSSPAETLTVVLDRQPPAPTLTIDDGAAAVRDADVALTIAATDTTSPVIGMRVSNTAVFSGEIQPLAAQMNWTVAFPGTDGPKDVYLEVWDAAGNRAETVASVALDTAPPTGTVTIEGGAARTNKTLVDVALSYTSDAVTHVLSTTPLPSDCSGVPWPGSDTAPPPTTQVTLDAPTTDEGEARTVYVCTRDAAGNVAMAFDTVIVDQGDPGGTLVLDGGAAYTLDASVDVTLSAPSDTQRMKVAADTPPDCTTATGWIAYSASTTATLGDTSGTHTVYACLEDAAGNTPDTPIFDRIIYDRSPPSVSLLIDEDASFTTDAIVGLTVSASDDLTAPDGGVTGMRFDNGSVPTSGEYEGYSVSRTWTVASPTAEGTKTVCVEVQDAAGRTASDCDTISLDLNNPTGAVQIAGGAAFSTSQTANIAFTGDGGTGYEYTWSTGALDCASATGWTAFDGSETVSHDFGADGFHQVSGCFREPSGRTALASDGITIDTGVPPSPLPEDPSADEWLATGTPTLRWSASAGADLYRLTVRRGATVVVNGVDVFNNEYTPTSAWTGGDYTFEVVARDNAGNQSPLDAAFPRAFHVDTTSPTSLGGLTVLGGSPTADRTPALRWDTASDTQASATELSYVLEIADGTSFSALVLSAELVGTATATMTYTVESPLNEGTYAWRVRARDLAGNTQTVTAGGNLVIDATAPSAPAFEAVDSPTTSPLTLNWTAVAGADGYRLRILQNPGQGAACGTGWMNVDTGKSGTTHTQTFPSTAGCNYTAVITALDALGNESTGSSIGFRVDTVAPSVSSGAVVINGGDPAAASEVVTVRLAASGATQVKLLDYETTNCSTSPSVNASQFDGATAQSFTPLTTYVVAPNNSTNNTVAPTDSCKWIYAVFGDDAGNFSPPSTTARDSIVLDTVEPDAPQIATESAVIDGASILVQLGQDALDHNFKTYQIRNNALQANFVAVAPENPSCITGGALCEFAVTLAQNQENRISVRAVDDAGNASAEDFVVVREDSLAPGTVANLKLVGRNESIAASWDANGESDLGGYELFYTAASGSSCPSDVSAYVGTFADQGASPLDVGVNTAFALTGIPNGSETCVAVRAYDKTEPPNTSGLTLDSLTPWEVTPNKVATITSSDLGVSSGIYALAARRGLLYVAAHNAGLVELDVSNASCFDLSGAAFRSCTGLVKNTTHTLRYPTRVVLHGNHAFVGQQTNGLRIYRLQEGSAPVHLFTLSVGTVTDVAASGDLLAVSHTSGWSLYDLTDLYKTVPTSPSLHHSEALGGAAHEVDIQNDKLVTTDTYPRLRVWDISTPTAPSLDPYFNDSNGVYGLVGTSAYVYGIDNYSNFTVWDWTPTGGPNHDDLARIGGTAAKELHAYGPFMVGAGSGRLTLYDVSTPSDPRFVGEAQERSSNNSSNGSVALDGHRAFYANVVNELYVYHLGGTTALELIPNDDSALGGEHAVMLGNTMFTSEDRGFGVQAYQMQFDGLFLDHDGGGGGRSYFAEADYFLSTRSFSSLPDRYYVNSRNNDGTFTASLRTMPNNQRIESGELRWPYFVSVTTLFSTPNTRVYSLRMPAGGLVDNENVSTTDYLSNGDQGSAIYGGQFFFAIGGTNTSVAGIWKASFNTNSGVLGTPSRVHAMVGLDGFRIYGRHAYFWDGDDLYAYLLDNPNESSWTASDVNNLGTANLYSPGRPTFAGASVFLPERSSLRLAKVTYDPATYRATGMTSVASVPTSYSSDVIVTGDRVHVVNYNRGFQIYRLR